MNKLSFYKFINLNKFLFRLPYMKFVNHDIFAKF